MQPTRLELDLGRLVMLVVRLPEKGIHGYATSTAVLVRKAKAIPVRWYNGEPYVREAPCQHPDLTTRWIPSDWRQGEEPATIEMPTRETVTTCDACGEKLHIFTEEEK